MRQYKIIVKTKSKELLFFPQMSENQLFERFCQLVLERTFNEVSIYDNQKLLLTYKKLLS